MLTLLFYIQWKWMAAVKRHESKSIITGFFELKHFTHQFFLLFWILRRHGQEVLMNKKLMRTSKWCSSLSTYISTSLDVSNLAACWNTELLHSFYLLLSILIFFCDFIFRFYILVPLIYNFCSLGLGRHIQYHIHTLLGACVV